MFLCEYDLDVLFVSSTNVINELLSSFASTLYPLIGESPSSDGGLHDKLFWVDETLDAVNFIGGVDTVAWVEVDVE